MLRIVLLSLAALIVGVLPAQAESKPPKAFVEELSQKAFDGFLKVKNAQGEHIVKPEDAKKLKHPMTSYEEREMAVVRGTMSGYAKWCGLKWEKDFFAPYIISLKKEHGKNWTPFQYAYTEMLHGLSMAVGEKSKAGKTCTDAEKQKLASMAKK